MTIICSAKIGENLEKNETFSFPFPCYFNMVTSVPCHSTMVLNKNMFHLQNCDIKVVSAFSHILT